MTDPSRDWEEAQWVKTFFEKEPLTFYKGSF